MIKMVKKNNNEHCLFRIKPGVYLSASSKNPKRVPIKSLTPVIILEKHHDNYVVAMIDSQTLILVHNDSLEKV